ncbi:glycerate kinase [Paenibacillus arenilitoris]|uniref:Glycerate kinase n=1 Tax=Paenibacillus arenilitoris TaxID=2772299 RepID=A0A927CMB2_9BACL|nr:glycerate kinase [Paenibacillus arenilitoris]MBD2869452.1 glycerate kinase [Paenibacillus arenilitoris]
MKVVLAFDSFKGSLSSAQAGSAAARAIRSVYPDAECDVIPLADGGEGTVAAVLEAAGGTGKQVAVNGPHGEPASAFVGMIRDGRGTDPTAVLETAGICGLTMVPEGRLDPFRASSRGVGEAILQLLDDGVRSFVIGLGGSAVNDGGMGMLAALGAVFRDKEGNRLQGCGADLLSAASADMDGLDPRLGACAIRAATDVANPLCGPSGATMVFGRQKGASPQQQEALDAAMKAYADMIEASVGRALQAVPGAGAAGGLGFALLAAGGELVPGAGWVTEAAGLRARVRGADWVVTGEGRSDGQTMYGKLPVHVADAAREAGARCMLLSGSLGDHTEELEARFDGCFSITKEPAALADCMEQAEELLERTVRQLFRLLRAAADERA